jgi:hypothetical protein
MATPATSGQSDTEIALIVIQRGYKGNEAVVETSALLAQQHGGAYYTYTGRAIAALGQVESPAQKAQLQANVQQLMSGAQQAMAANPLSTSGLTIFTSKTLWVRIGIGALGSLCLYIGWMILMRDEIKNVGSAVIKDVET